MGDHFVDICFDFQGKNFVVSGASSGIGQQLTLELLEAGACVLAIARHMSSCVDLLKKYSDRLVAADLDVKDHESLKTTIYSFVDQFGKIDGSVHCAGQANLMPINVWNYKKASDIMDVNLWAGIALMKILARKIVSNHGASYVYVSSVSAVKGQKGLSVYSASKAALDAMVRCAAQELAVKSYRVNSVCLGWVETNMTKNVENVSPDAVLGKGKPEDVSGMILFLLSSKASWITGASFVVDGGYLA